MQYVDIGVIDVPHLCKRYIGLVLAYECRDFLELLADNEDEAQSLLLLRTEAVDLEQIFVINE